MLNAAWLIVHLIASAMPGTAAAAGPAGVTCSYQACMAKCSRLNGPICNSYCDAKIPQRVSAGICAAQGGGNQLGEPVYEPPTPVLARSIGARL